MFFFLSLHKVAVTEPCCMDMPSCSNTPTPAWWQLFSISIHVKTFWWKPVNDFELWQSCRHLSTTVSTLSLLQYLSCLTTSRSLTDKLAFDVGLQEDSTGCFCTFRFFRTSDISKCLHAKRAGGFQERPAGGPSTLPPSRGLKARRSEWVMTSFLSAFPQRDIW